MKILKTTAIVVKPSSDPDLGHYIGYEDPDLAKIGTTVSGLVTGVDGCQLKTGDELKIFKKDFVFLGLLGVACESACEKYKKNPDEGGCKACYRA